MASILLFPGHFDSSVFQTPVSPVLNTEVMDADDTLSAAGTTAAFSTASFCSNCSNICLVSSFLTCLLMKEVEKEAIVFITWHASTTFKGVVP